MPVDSRYLPVNWVDGMKISRIHFEQTDRFIQYQLREISGQLINNFNFGILPGENSLDFSIHCDSNLQIDASLKWLNAVTPNGSTIQTIPEDKVGVKSNFPELAKNYGLQNSQAQTLLAVVTIDPFGRIPSGEPLPDENPPRFPNCKPQVILNILPADQVSTQDFGNSLIIGKIVFKNGELSVQKEFIPPSTSINSVASLAEWYDKFRQFLEGWEQSSLRIIQKVNSKPQTQQPNSLATSIQMLSEKIYEHLISEKLTFLWILPQSPPVYMCVSLLRLIQYTHALLQCYPEKEREEMLNYFAEWTEVQAGTIENQTLRALQIQYNHHDISSILNEIAQVYNVYLQIFQKLSQLDFIGKRKGQNIFVIEQELKESKQNQKPPEKPNTRWSPLS